jgi:integrase
MSLPTGDYRLGKRGRDWVAVWYEGEKRHRYRLTANTQADARAALRAFAEERERLLQPNRRLTVGALWAEYVAEREAQGRVAAPRMRDAWKRLGPTFGLLDPAGVSGADVRTYISHRRAVASDGTIHVELGYLRAALRFAVKRGVLDRAPHIELPSKPRPKNRHLSDDEARRLINACVMPHVRLFVLLALHTAGRPSSILDLTWDRIDFGSARIQLDNPARDRTAKGRATVPMDGTLIEPLREAHAAALTNYVIEWAGSGVLSIKKGFSAAARRAGLSEVTPYVLRHTAAVWMAEGGVPMSEISQYMGHTSTAVTERVYARFSPQHLRRGADAIAARLKDTVLTVPLGQE